MSRYGFILPLIKRPSGQVTVETAVFITAVIGALVGMAIYMQRAYQGYLFSNSSAQGLQFDPNDNYAVGRTIRLSQTQEITIQSGPTVSLVKGNDDLPSVPGGKLPPRSRLTRVNVTDDWDLTGGSLYEAK